MVSAIGVGSLCNETGLMHTFSFLYRRKWCPPPPYGFLSLTFGLDDRWNVRTNRRAAGVTCVQTEARCGTPLSGASTNSPDRWVHNRSASTTPRASAGLKVVSPSERFFRLADWYSRSNAQPTCTQKKVKMVNARVRLVIYPVSR